MAINFYSSISFSSQTTVAVISSPNVAPFMTVYAESSSSTCTATYNGASMSIIISMGSLTLSGSGAPYGFLFFLANPTSGTNNLVFSASTSGSTWIGDGIQESGEPDKNNFNSNHHVSSGTSTITPTPTNGWCIMFASALNGNITAANSNWTKRTSGTGEYIAGDSNGSVTAGSPYTQTINCSLSNVVTVCQFSLIPAVIQPANASFLINFL